MENPRLAVFDIDGTLLPGTSCERVFFKYLIKNRILGFKNLINFAVRAIALAPKGKAYVIKANKSYLQGLSLEYMDKIGTEFFQGHIADRISTEGMTRLCEHKNNGDGIILLSGMPEFLLRNFAEFLGISEYYGSVLDINDGRFTGKTLGPFPLARGKVQIIETILRKHDLAWDNVTAYADHFSDRFLLQKAKIPVAVNPDNKLKRLAQTREWRIEYFSR